MTASSETLDVWLVVNRQWLIEGNAALVELLPYLNTGSSSEDLMPLVVRLEAASGEVSYSDFDAGKASALYAKAASSLRAGLDAIQAGDATAAGHHVTRGLAQFGDAVDYLNHVIPDPLPPAEQRSAPTHTYWLWVGLTLLLLVLML